MRRSRMKLRLSCSVRTLRTLLSVAQTQIALTQDYCVESVVIGATFTVECGLSPFLMLDSREKLASISLL
jgi:hypothetical protein